MHIYEVICTPYHGVVEDQIPDSLLRGRKPCFTRIMDSNGEQGDEELIEYCVEKNINRVFEKQYFFDPPFFSGRSTIPDDYFKGLIDVFWKCKQCLRTWSPVSGKRFAKCPRCGMFSGIDILYGMPSYEAITSIMRGEISTGGCCIDPYNPKWVCKECGHAWGGPQEEFDRRLLESLDRNGESI